MRIISLIIIVFSVLLASCLFSASNEFCPGNDIHSDSGDKVLRDNSAIDGNTIKNNDPNTADEPEHLIYVANSGAEPFEKEEPDNTPKPAEVMFVKPGLVIDISDPDVNTILKYDLGITTECSPIYMPPGYKENGKRKNNLMVINSVKKKIVSIKEWDKLVMPMWLDMTDNGILCVADSSTNIILMDTSYYNSVISTIPIGNNIFCDIALGNSDTKLFCALMGVEPSIGVIDMVSKKYIKTINLPRMKDNSVGQPWGIGTYRNGQMAYVTLGTQTGGELVFINTNTNSVEGTVSVGQQPFGVAVTPDGTKIYVANGNSDDISVVDAITKQVTATIHVGKSPFRVAVSPHGLKAIVTNKESNNVSIIDIKTDSVIATLPVGKEPIGVCISKDGKRAYVANHGSDNVTIIDLANNSVIGNTVPFTGGKPYDVVVK